MAIFESADQTLQSECSMEVIKIIDEKRVLLFH